MIEKYYSKVDPCKLLHVIHRLNIKTGENHRVDLIDENNFIQCSFLSMNGGKTFKPHKHIRKHREYHEQIAQESWVVIKGRVRCIFYDIDDTVLATPILEQGDASFTLDAGHNYEILEDDTIVYEYKTGPYEGQSNDKVFI
jgi:cupin fold WbuC family metalloprotein